MLITYSELKNYVLNAQDGEIGRVRDLLFDDQFWAARYFDVNTSKWFLGRRVLISPISVEQPNTDEHLVDVDLTKQAIKDSPPIEHDEPISQQYTRNFNVYFGYPHYWMGQDVWGPSPNPGNLRPSLHENMVEEMEALRDQTGSAHLRSMHEVIGYKIYGMDEEIGKVEDFVLDTDTWQIRYVVVDSKGILTSANKLLAASWVRDIVWHERKVMVNIDKKTYESAPKVDEPITHDDEMAVFIHFNREPYWTPTRVTHNAHF